MPESKAGSGALSGTGSNTPTFPTRECASLREALRKSSEIILLIKMIWGGCYLGSLLSGLMLVGQGGGRGPGVAPPREVR